VSMLIADISSAAWELTMLTLSMSVAFSAICLTVASFITKSCQQRILQDSALADLGYGGIFRVHLVTVKIGQYFQSYAQVKKGPVFLNHSAFSY